MKKMKITAALAAMLLCLGSCGGEAAATTAAKATASAAAEKPAKTASASEITAAVLDKVPIKSSIEKGADDLEYYFGSLDTGDIKDCSYCMCASGAYPDEIAVFRFGSEESASAGLEAVKERMEQQRSTYETYTPDEMYKFDGAAAEARGCWVIYLITSDNSAALGVVNEYIS